MSDLLNLSPFSTGQIVAPNYARLRWFNVLEFGAVGDDSTDDSTAIQAAVDAAGAAGGGIVRFPSNLTYLVGSPIDLADNVVLLGNGYNTVIKATTNIRAIRLDGLTHVTISNLRLFGGLSNTADPTSFGGHTGIFIDGSSDVFIDRVWVHGFGKQGIGVNGDAASDNTVLNFTNIVAFDNLTGIFIFRGTDRLLIQGIHCYRNGRWGIVIDDGTTASASYQPKNHTVQGCFTHDNSIGGILIEGSKYTSIVGNHCYANGITQYFQQTVEGDGIKLGLAQDHFSPQSINVSSNHCRLNRRHGITLTGALDNNINNNVCTDNGNGNANGRNIQIAKSSGTPDIGSDRNKVHDNILKKETAVDMAVALGVADSDCEHNEIYNNTFIDEVGSWTVISNAGTQTRIGFNEGYDDAGETFGDGDTTPSVGARRRLYIANNTGATTITNFDDGLRSQTITVLFLNGNTTLSDSGSMRLAGSANWNPQDQDTITLQLRSTTWYELSRSET